MDFGKVRDTRNLDLTLPQDDPATAGVLAAAGNAEGAFRVQVGCPVWQDDAMARKLCPEGTPKSRRLACYARQFNAIELNTTGYRIDADRLRQWASETPLGFRFHPKVPMDVTHGPNLDVVWERFSAHAAAAGVLGDRLGCLFLQFPETFGPDRFAELERFLDAGRAVAPLALEVRHPAWFRDPKWKDRLFAMLRDRGVASIITDTPGRRDALHQRLTTPSAFIRFNGHALGKEDFDRLDAWALRADRWRRQGLRSLIFFVHMDPVDRTVELAAHFIRSLNRVSGLAIPEPRIRSDEEEPRLAL